MLVHVWCQAPATCKCKLKKKDTCRYIYELIKAYAEVRERQGPAGTERRTLRRGNLTDRPTDRLPRLLRACWPQHATPVGAPAPFDHLLLAFFFLDHTIHKKCREKVRILLGCWHTNNLSLTAQPVSWGQPETEWKYSSFLMIKDAAIIVSLQMTNTIFVWHSYTNEEDSMHARPVKLSENVHHNQSSIGM